MFFQESSAFLGFSIVLRHLKAEPPVTFYFSKYSFLSAPTET